MMMCCCAAGVLHLTTGKLYNIRGRPVNQERPDTASVVEGRGMRGMFSTGLFDGFLERKLEL